MNSGSKQEEVYLASGLTEEILIALTRFPSLAVIGPLAREAFPVRGHRAQSIGQRYGVRFELDGTVRKRGQTIRVTARLIDALSGAHLWAQALDYSLETASIAEIEQEIVGRVAATIADAFGAIPRALAKESLGRRADSLSDYDAVLRFHHHIRTLTEASSDEAIWPVYNVHWNIG